MVKHKAHGNLRCWTKAERSRKELENKIVVTSTPEEKRGYSEAQARRLRHTESPGPFQKVSGTEGRKKPGPCGAAGCIRGLGFSSRRKASKGFRD